MDHFARPDDELARARRDRTLHRNFQGYTTKAGTDLLGFGMSAIGSVGAPLRPEPARARRLPRGGRRPGGRDLPRVRASPPTTSCGAT